MTTYSLEDYVRHGELYGPECILETARGDLSDGDLGSLKAFLDSKVRVYRWKNGRWEQRRERAVRQCEHCGLDLPPDVRAGTRYHKHCGVAARSARYRARRSDEAAGAAASRSSA